MSYQRLVTVLSAVFLVLGVRWPAGASLGAIITMLVTAGINWRFQRDFAREWSESWRVKAAGDTFTVESNP